MSEEVEFLNHLGEENLNRWGDLTILLDEIQKVKYPMSSWIIIHIDTRDMHGVLTNLSSGECILPLNYTKLNEMNIKTTTNDFINKTKSYNIEELRKFYELSITYKWIWAYNWDFKYVDIHIDLGAPNLFYINNGDGEQATLEELLYQHK